MFKPMIKWSLQEFPDLPWRIDRTPYSTLVSEIMLQQTTVGTVINHFERFLKKYPDIASLAKSTEEEMTIAWKGLGYYRRARNLRKAAIDIDQRFGGVIPQDFNDLISIDGIGDYTASAILSIGMDLPFLSVDANLERVLARHFLIDGMKGPKLQKKIRTLFQNKELLQNLSQLGPRNTNEALMDLGRTICQARKADCEICPLKKSCLAFKEGKVYSYPEENVKVKKSSKMLDLKLLRVILISRGKILGAKKKESEWLQGQIEVPSFILQSEDKSLKQYPQAPVGIDFDQLPCVKSSITKYKIENYILVMDANTFNKNFDRKKYRFYSLDLDNLNHASVTKKLLTKVKLL